MIYKVWVLKELQDNPIYKACCEKPEEKLTKELAYEGNVDGVHLTDLGFYQLAKKLAKIIKQDIWLDI